MRQHELVKLLAVLHVTRPSFCPSTGRFYGVTAGRPDLFPLKATPSIKQG
jgi:hypothetical protein